MAWEKGQSGNPGGRGTPKPFKDALSVALKDGDGAALRRIAQKLVKLAENGESWAVQMVADRTDGKVAQPIAGDDDSPPIQTTHIERLIIEHTINPDSESLPASTGTH